ncbi:FAD-dependent oxidoreductase [Salipaludibacillus daqingensis]|uniref:FAD-dependent oxidoreductase n=1 Tax=Salipaludibacillus daqingensis TaxID=3041001 RepID=UPI002476BE3E|nr:FAD-dependent oxidoreductase [Salipaludibacillus daqingensis]
MGKQVMVVGSGFAGLTAGALLQKEGFNVTLLEAAAEWGGCAGKFQRKNFTFPVGATLGMGFEPGGLHKKVNDYLSIKTDVSELETVMDVRIGNRLFPYYTERSRFLTMWEKEEPNDSLRIMSFFEEVWRIGQTLRRHMLHYPVLPPQSKQEFSAFIRGFSPMSVTLLPYLGRTLGSLVKKHKLEKCHAFTHFINGVLMDSMQTTYEKCELMMGATALDIYHHGAFYVKGGLYRVAESLVNSLKQNGGVVKKPRKVESIRKRGDKWIIIDHRNNEYEADHVVLNVPIAAIGDLLDGSDYDKLKPSLKNKEDPTLQWGTFTTYLAIRDEMIPEDLNLFHQVMIDPEQDPSGANHFFMSLSEKDDTFRAPKGYRTMTVSTHIDLKNWQSKEDYDEQSKKIYTSVLAKLEELAPGASEALPYQMTGGPRAWEKFVKRNFGGVGGFPQIKANALWKAIQHRTKVDGLWLCGDNVFPGAGSIGATSSGVHVARSISGERIV